jgi:hypothetical protein
LLARIVALCCCRNQTFLRRANRRGARAYRLADAVNALGALFIRLVAFLTYVS